MKEASGILLEGRQIASLVQCCHCGKHFEIVKGSGNIRGFCTQCSRVTCGSETCCLCVPLEVRLDYQEGKKVNFKYSGNLALLERKGQL